jgi:hypothetical protein
MLILEACRSKFALHKGIVEKLTKKIVTSFVIHQSLFNLLTLAKILGLSLNTSPKPKYGRNNERD